VKSTRGAVAPAPLAALALTIIACASSPQVVPAEFPADATIAIAGFYGQPLNEGAFGVPQAYEAFRRDLGSCTRGKLVGDDVVMSSETYRRISHLVANETWPDIPNGRLDSASAVRMARDVDAAIVIGVDLIPYLQRGTKIEGAETAKVAVSGRAAAYDRQGHAVWTDEVSAWSPSFPTHGVYEERLRAAATTAMCGAASDLVARLCTALQVH
jgi:hypothetical protein